MSDFSARIFQLLADSYQDRPGNNVRFPDCELERLQAFKDSLFRLLMLRAKRCIEVSYQERGGVPQESRHAVAEARFIWTTDDLHPNRTEFKFLSNMGPITRLMPAPYDEWVPKGVEPEDDELLILRQEFMDGVYLLSCA